MKYLVMIISLLLIPIPSFAEDAPPHVMDVILVNTNGDDAKYQEIFDQITAASKKAGSTGVRRMWGAGYAGTDTGSVITTIEYPSLKSLAESNEKLAASEDFQAAIAAFVEAGMIADSRSLLFNVR
ncbi:MAG: hypothetical protein O6945_00415 [Gammaproteobacteria bacterium]|nr:hypothetical protein [Gammaproteobacteria bacterium]